MGQMLTAKQVAEVKGCSGRYIKRLIQEGKLQAQEVLNDKNRKTYLVPLEALDEELQQKWYQMNLENPSEEISTPEPVPDKKAVDHFSESERQEIDFWISLVEQWQQYRMKPGVQEKLRETDKVIIIDEAQNLKFLTLEEIRGWVDEDIFTGKPGIGIVLIGNVEVYNKMLGKQEAIFAQQFNRTKLHGRYRTSDIQREDVVKFFPVLEEKGMQKEIDYLLSISHSKWGIRGMVSVFNNAVNNEDISFEGLEKMANTMGIRFI